MREMQPPRMPTTPTILALAATAYLQALHLGWSRRDAYALFVATYAASFLIMSRRSNHR